MNTVIRDHFEKNDPLLYSFIEKVEWKEQAKTIDHFVDLVESIISQQLSIKAADTIYSRLKKLFPDEAINPKELLKLSDDQIRAVGISYSKIGYIKDLAQKVMNKELDFASFDTLKDEEIITELIKVKGIGRWTAEMFLMSAMGREDIFSYGDLGIRRAIQRMYKLKKEPTVKQAEKISKKWIPYRTIACRILWKSLEIK